MKCLDLKDMKALYTLDLAEHAVANKINEEPEFNWCVKEAIWTRARIILLMESMMSMRLLQIRMDPRRNTVLPPINLALSYQKQ